jgi:two-component system, cell cycle sensor histidine kinase and response regulator CckA
MDATALRAVFEAVATPQVVLDSAGVVLVATQAYLRSTASAREAVIGRALSELPPYANCRPAQRELEVALEVTLRSGVRHAVLLEGVTPSASGTRFTSATLTPIAGPDGSVTHLLHTFEAEGRAAGPTVDERRLRKMIENSYETIGLVDERGSFTFVCGIERVLGFSEQEWLALPALETIHRDDVAGFGAEINRMFSKAGGRFLTRVRSRHKDGSWRVLEASAVNRLDDPDIASVVITFRDVTAQIAMQEEARRSEQRLRIALSAARALCWEIDFVDNVHTFSDDYSAYYELPAGSYPGNDALHAVHPDDRGRVLSAALHARDVGSDFSVEFRGLPRADGTRWYASHGKSFRDDQDKPRRMLGVTWEISERRRMEEERRLLEERLQQSQKLESLGVLAGGIAHDFNNLLMAVLGNASLLEDRFPQDADARCCLSQIEEATRRASDLCRQLLAYAGKGEFVLSSVDVNALIESTTHLLHVSISKKVVLRFDLQYELPRIQVDATQLRQVLMNLVINASDAIGDRSGVIAIRTGLMTADRAYLDRALLSAELQPGIFAFVEVSDTGAGMSEETISHIFEPFFSTKFPGRGLGLASVLGIVRGHRGALRVHSLVDRGSTFRFLLPVPDVQLDVEEEPQKLSPAFVGEGALLLVDDEETIRAVAGRMLEALGFRVLTARDGREAIRIHAEYAQEFTCVIMDLTMPHVDGEEAMRALRSKNPAQRVLLISGYNPQDSVNRLLRPGLTGFLQKPFNLSELTSALHALLG